MPNRMMTLSRGRDASQEFAESQDGRNEVDEVLTEACESLGLTESTAEDGAGTTAEGQGSREDAIELTDEDLILQEDESAAPPLRPASERPPPPFTKTIWRRKLEKALARRDTGNEIGRPVQMSIQRGLPARPKGETPLFSIIHMAGPSMRAAPVEYWEDEVAADALLDIESLRSSSEIPPPPPRDSAVAEFVQEPEPLAPVGVSPLAAPPRRSRMAKGVAILAVGALIGAGITERITGPAAHPGIDGRDRARLAALETQQRALQVFLAESQVSSISELRDRLRRGRTVSVDRTANEPRTSLADNDPADETEGTAERMAQRLRGGGDQRSRGVPSTEPPEGEALSPAAASPHPARTKKDRSAQAAPAPAAAIPTVRSREAVRRGMEQVGALVRACGQGSTGTVIVSVTIDPKGAVAAARTVGPFANTPVGDCIADAVRKAQFEEAFGHTVVKYPYDL